jgi:hypothetical protein
VGPRTFFVRLLVVGSVLAAGLGVGGSASADPSADEPSAAEVVALVDDVAGLAVGQAPEAVEAAGPESGPDEGQAVIDVGPDASEVSLGIPGADEEASRFRGNLVYAGVEADTSVVARSTAAGTQALIVIDGPDAPSSFRFPIEIDGRPVRFERAEAGSFAVYEEGATEATAQIQPAWAVDAAGRPVPTHYEVRDGSLEQIVDHAGASYPVVADPQFTWGWVTGTVYFTRSETRKASTFSGMLSIVATACAYSAGTGPGAGPFCAGAAAHAAIISTYANHINGQGKCLKIKLPVFLPGSVRRGDRNCR